MFDKPVNRIEKFREALASRKGAHESTLEWIKSTPGYNKPVNREVIQERITEIQAITKEFDEMFPKVDAKKLSETPGGFLITNKHGDLVPPEELGKDELVQIVRLFADHMNKLLVQIKAVVRSLKWGG